MRAPTHCHHHLLTRSFPPRRRSLIFKPTHKILQRISPQSVQPVNGLRSPTALPLPQSHDSALPGILSPPPLPSAPTPTHPFFRPIPNPHTAPELISIEAPPSSPTHPTPARRAIQLTTANLRNNEPFGDIMDEKADGTFRIWGNNFNGLSIDESGGDFMELCEEATTMQADIVAGTEHNLDPRKYYV
jgi:hypothetical protein